MIALGSLSQYIFWNEKPLLEAVRFTYTERAMQVGGIVHLPS